ncbi:uncharacterized protein A1O5_03704 [Cladophialophora psammophila CBS 110553]|uniref:Tat pathway signal sequence n=1 Tax=Cladophialophora psammophila CBS 110553 TaxID=1182543 RepID=W9WX82_9EURO|nr:uncharacterized protein A1O5_03704 [Cladophialophora psammophila CBS 110553]EXJ72558.1 hypothetical protein A1O5_03704 [Cladophialophora psammophila CBS 110553]
MDSYEESNVPFLLDLKDDSTERSIIREKPVWNSKRLLWWTFCAMVLVVSNAFTFYGARVYRHSQLDRVCTAHTSQNWSPVEQDVNIHYSSTRFNASFYKESIYRQAASPEVDAAWEELGTELKGVVLTVDEAKKSGLELDRVMVGEDYGGPGYVAFVEVTHQIHCLNLLRRGLWFNYEYYQSHSIGEFADGDRIVKLHIGHCLDTLRQALMCSSDTGLLPFVWVGNPPKQFPDFFREHKCRNFEPILEFAKRREVKALEHMKAVPHKGALILDDFP